MAAASRKRLILLRCGLVVVGCCVAIVIAEGALRVMGVSFPRPYLADVDTGTRLQPGWSGWFTKEGSAYAVINRAGFRDRDHPVQKPANTLRILVLGDSYVEAVQVAQEQTFWSILERDLGAALRTQGQSVEVIAMGVSGWGTAQQLQALERYGFAYEPDWVVLAFFAGNDLRNNDRELEGDNARPYFKLENDELRLDESFRTDPRFLKARSPLTKLKVQLINCSRVLQLIQESREQTPTEVQPMHVAVSSGLDDQCFLPPSNEAWERTWKITERLIERMHEQCIQHHARFLVLAVNSPIQVHPDPEKRASFCQRIGVENLDYADERIQKLGMRRNVPVVVLAGPLLEHASRQQLHLHGFSNTRLGEGHWNADGHAIVAKTLASRLLAELR